MAKDKCVKPSNPPKKKKLDLSDSQVSMKDFETKVKKKRARVEVEEAIEQISSVTNKEDVKKLKKDKKHKKKRLKEETQTKQTDIPDQPSCPEATLELDAEEDLSPEEKRVLERKMKKIMKKEEKKRQGQTTQPTEAAGPTASQQALDYLMCWADKRSVWKFQKTRQTWLLQHMFDSDEIPDDRFCVLLQYLEGLCGMARDTTVQKALSLVEESGRAPEDPVVQQRAHRAREVIQLFG
ncbi:protein cholesin [Xenentodon cancila]